eukprot:CAMPEP_0181063358 /NCGR_PEP_ID=MMETSP1070-20121207/23602_1 /TAXON_ID=265543 /ORGANISM="Minutocellus polymorphus, Strain NH13" /LENGTH=137 /DNA_ID=CAMNT_0023143555 /DNA_START=53 /DNA_END=463 /DNA_ORIENTATION=+
MNDAAPAPAPASVQAEVANANTAAAAGGATAAGLWSPSDVPVRPPPTVRHPLHLLEEFLGSLEEEETNKGDVEEDQQANQEVSQQQQQQQQQQQVSAAAIANRNRRILRVADFLYGDSGSARTVLDNALEVLDGGYG